MLTLQKPSKCRICVALVYPSPKYAFVRPKIALAASLEASPEACSRAPEHVFVARDAFNNGAFAWSTTAKDASSPASSAVLTRARAVRCDRSGDERHERRVRDAKVLGRKAKIVGDDLVEHHRKREPRVQPARATAVDGDVARKVCVLDCVGRAHAPDGVHV